MNRSVVLLAGVRWGPTPERLMVDIACPKLKGIQDKRKMYHEGR